MNTIKKKQAKEFSAFMTDVVGLMEKHKIEHLLLVFPMNGFIRNSYLHTKGEDEFYSKISDGLNAWMRQGVNN